MMKYNYQHAYFLLFLFLRFMKSTLKLAIWLFNWLPFCLEIPPPLRSTSKVLFTGPWVHPLWSKCLPSWQPRSAQVFYCNLSWLMSGKTCKNRFKLHSTYATSNEQRKYTCRGKNRWKKTENPHDREQPEIMLFACRNMKNHYGLIFPKSGLAGSFRGKGSEISWLGISIPQMQEGIECKCQKTSQIKSVIRVSNFAHDTLLESFGYFWMILRIDLLNHAVLAISSPLFGAFRMFASCMLRNEWKLL